MALVIVHVQYGVRILFVVLVTALVIALEDDHLVVPVDWREWKSA